MIKIYAVIFSRSLIIQLTHHNFIYKNPLHQQPAVAAHPVLFWAAEVIHSKRKPSVISDIRRGVNDTSFF